MNTLAKTPWHLWALGIISLVWFAGGANDYVQMKTENIEYMQAAADASGVPLQTIQDYFGGYPLWASAVWALGVWGAVAGALLLLLRSRFAFHAMLISLFGLLASTAYSFTSNMPAEMSTPFFWVFSVLIWLSVIGLAYYARRMTAAGVLR